MMMKATFALVAALVFSPSAGPQEKSDKFRIFVTGLNEAAPVAQSLIQKMRDSKPFAPVTQQDPSKVVVLISCMSRKQSEPFVCMYVSEYNGATFKTFLGGGLNFSLHAEDVADSFLASIAEDIVERFDNTAKDNLRQSLESCLFMTDSKCNVPDSLQKEFAAKQLTLGQYLLKKNE
jgi:hypothetical protein